jgi:hypothetical protein
MFEGPFKEPSAEVEIKKYNVGDKVELLNIFGKKSTVEIAKSSDDGYTAWDPEAQMKSVYTPQGIEDAIKKLADATKEEERERAEEANAKYKAGDEVEILNIFGRKSKVKIGKFSNGKYIMWDEAEGMKYHYTPEELEVVMRGEDLKEYKKQNPDIEAISPATIPEEKTFDEKAQEEEPQVAAETETNKEIEIKALIKVTQEIPAGEHWKVNDLISSEITVPAGSSLVITKGALKSKIIVQKGGTATISGRSIESEIINQ